MQYTKRRVFLYIVKLTLAGGFMYLFGSRLLKVSENEIATKFTVEDGIKHFPSLNICPAYNGANDHSLLIHFQDNYTLDDLNKLPKAMTLLQPEVRIYVGTKLNDIICIIRQKIFFK